MPFVTRWRWQNGMRRKVTVCHVYSAPQPLLPVTGMPGNVPSRRLFNPTRSLNTCAGFAPLHFGDRGESVEIVVREGNAAKEIVLLAEQLPADLLVLGTHGRSGFERLFLGSVTEKVLRTHARSGHDGPAARHATGPGTVQDDSVPAGFLRRIDASASRTAVAPRVSSPIRSAAGGARWRNASGDSSAQSRDNWSREQQRTSRPASTLRLRSQGDCAGRRCCIHGSGRCICGRSVAAEDAVLGRRSAVA